MVKITHMMVSEALAQIKPSSLKNNRRHRAQSARTHQTGTITIGTEALVAALRLADGQVGERGELSASSIGTESETRREQSEVSVREIGSVALVLTGNENESETETVIGTGPGIENESIIEIKIGRRRKRRKRIRIRRRKRIRRRIGRRQM